MKLYVGSHRVIRRIVVSLVLGVVACVAVAWACAWTIDGWAAINESDRAARRVDFFGEPRWAEVTRVERFGARLRYIHGILSPSDRAINEIDDVFVARVRIGSFTLGAKVQANPPSMFRDQSFPVDRATWSRVGWSTIDEIHDKGVEEEGAFGWPLPCLWGSYNSYASCDGDCCQELAEHPEWMIPLGATDYSMARALPLRPITLGFVIDSAMYAGLCYGLLHLLGAMRARVRRRARRCSSCGYDLRGGAHHACPECGLLTDK